MSVFFRTDASLVMGSGHVMRCLTLANALREHGLQSTFVCREHVGNLCDLIEEHGFSVVRLPLKKTSECQESALAHASWLGASQMEDAEQTRAAILRADARPAWLIVDHYALDQNWETTLRPIVDRLMVIDDLADRSHDCAILLDQNFFIDSENRYIHKIPVDCITLLGPAYALLQPLYAKLHSNARLKAGPIRRIFVFFGGADNENFTGRTISAFQRLGRPDIQLDVVMTGKSPYHEVVQKQIYGHPNICLHGFLPSLGPLMNKADLAVGAGGATTWERLCLGLPSVVISLAENQEKVSMDLAAEGLIKYLGDKKKVGVDEIYQTLATLIDTPSTLDWSAKCFEACDGKGALRVAHQLLSLTAIRSGDLGVNEKTTKVLA